MLENHPEYGRLHHSQTWPTVLPPHFSDSFLSDEFHKNVHPAEGFIFPAVGDSVVCMTDYQTRAHRGGKIPKDAMGEVVGLRKPDSGESGYIGCVVRFQEIKSEYPAGVVIPWDYASDPRAFVYKSKAKPGLHL